MVIDDCETIPDNFPLPCDGCPWIGRCKFTIKDCDCKEGKLINFKDYEIFIQCKHDNFFWIKEGEIH